VSVEDDLETVTHKFWIDYFELKNGRIKIFKRKNVSDKFYARFTFRDEPGYVQESLKTEDKDEAASVALEKYLHYEFRKKQGLAVKSKPFADIASEYIKHLNTQVERKEIKKAKYDHYRLMTERYFKAYFEDTLIGEIKKPQIEAYREWRLNYWVSGPGSKLRRYIYERSGQVIRSPIPKTWKGRVPTTSTLNSEETALRSIFKFGMKRGYLAENEMPTIRTENITWKPRSTFSDKEYSRLLAVGRSRIKEAEASKRDREAHQRFMVYQYVLIAAAGVSRDKDGNKRCLGSLRIFYATMRLLKGESLDLYDLALQMGTSVQMFQKTYSRLTARLKASKVKRKAFPVIATVEENDNS